VLLSGSGKPVVTVGKKSKDAEEAVGANRKRAGRLGINISCPGILLDFPFCICFAVIFYCQLHNFVSNLDEHQCLLQVIAMLALYLSHFRKCCR